GARLGTQQTEEVRDVLAVLGVLVPLTADVDMMGLDVEDKLVLGPALGEGLLIADLVGTHLVAGAEDLVESHQRRRHAAAGAEEAAPVEALRPRCFGADLLEP